MKNKQKAVLKFTLIILLIPFSLSVAKPTQTLLKQADSLFAKKQYTQSLELYQEILDQKQYSSSMLLKMAYIEDGLGHLSQSLYDLNLYYLASADEQALVKMEEVASKHNLQGYNANEVRKIEFLLQENYGMIIKVLAAITFFLFALLFYQKFRLHKKAIPVGIAILVLLGLLFFHVNFSQNTSRGIVFNQTTYLMSGPSAGSSVVSIIGEGHQLDILDKKDVWYHVKWMDQDVYLKENQVKLVKL